VHSDGRPVRIQRYLPLESSDGVRPGDFLPVPEIRFSVRYAARLGGYVTDMASSDAASGGARRRRQEKASAPSRRGRGAGPHAPPADVQRSRERASTTGRRRRSNSSDRTKARRPRATTTTTTATTGKQASRPRASGGPGPATKAGKQPIGGAPAGRERRRAASSQTGSSRQRPGLLARLLAWPADLASPAAAQAKTSARHAAGPHYPDRITGTSSPGTVARFGGGAGRSGSTRLPVLVVDGHPDRAPGDCVAAQYRARAGDRDRGARWGRRLDTDPRRSSASLSAIVSAYLIVTGGGNN
jgi:hypothetical protein